MNTTKDTHRLITLLVIGAITGMIGGAVMAMYTMLATATYLGMGFFTPLYAIASPLVGQQVLLTSMHQGHFYFALEPALFGLIIHMMWSALYGMIFGLIAYGIHLKGAAVVISGLVYGVLVMVFMSFIMVPIIGAPNLLHMLGWPSFTFAHLLFGFVLGLWPVLRAQDFTTLEGHQVRRVA